jgi:type II secretory pathway component PulF
MQGKFTLDNFKLKLAILGNLTLKSEISRLSRTLALLLSSGIAIVPSLEVSSSVLENSVLKSEIAGFKNDISAGINLSTAFKKSKFFPEFVTSLITIGEQTGALDKSLLRIADDYEKEVDRTLKALTRMLEPIIILVMGLLVGFIVLSMLLPIFQINLIVT